ncbi:hypothetical protein OG824_10400 [Streptomyces prunicolor]|uniref:hypothetical protein n=1 Tax=Streptomyces prunicolor TaxID=67348 RepID=UPI002252DB20|nr:hypothetical protein [Streptomyces prunicolor]MCX5235617.1 hypothetical protein [Streptomyces prunicolor]
MARTYREPTIKLLFGTATHCAYPGCTARLIFKDRGLFTPTVQIAHIRSEKENGPRYDPEYPDVKINEFENLLLLCGQHHPPVDQHSSSYATAELLQWKEQQAQQGERQVAGAELAAIERKLNREAPITSDDVLRGPIASLDQTERLQQAEERLTENPLEAAVLFNEVAGHLEDSPFVHHASIIRNRQCVALEAGASYVEAARLRVDLGWRSYLSGDRFAVSQQIKKTEKYAQSLSEDSRRAILGLSYAAAFGYERQVKIDDLADAFDQIQLSDQGALQLALTFAEESITWRRPEMIRSRYNALSALAGTTASDEVGLTVRARILMCLAEANGDWDPLVQQARLSYPPAVTAWISARYARYLTLVGKPDESIQRWLDAIESAVTASLNDSAADWLYGLRATRLLYWMNDSDPNDLHRLAQALRAAGNGAVLPEPYQLAERAASRMLDRNWPDALQCLHQQLRHAVITASWAAELTTHERFGDLFVATEKWHEVPQCYVRSARGMKLENLAKTWPDEALRFLPPGREIPLWERIAVFRFAAVAGKSFPREIACQWAENACQELINSPQSYSPTSIWVPAFKAFSENADEATLGIAQDFVGLTANFFQREPGTHRHTDKPLIKAISKIFERHNGLRNRILEMLCDAIVIGNEVGEQALIEGEAALRTSPDLVASRLSDAASAGNKHAALSLILTRCDTAPAISLARQNLDRYTQPLNIQPGVMDFEAGLDDAALLVTVLGEEDRRKFVESMLVRALEVADIESNRASAIEAIATVGPTLSNEGRVTVFDALISFGKNPTESVASMNYGSDPFSRFRVTVGDFSLAALAAYAAGKVAHTAMQYETVQKFALTLLSSANNSVCRVLALMFRDIPEGALVVDVEMFASHANSWLRCFAAVAWGRNPQQWPGLGERLATDKDPGVRLALARALGDASERESIVNLLRQDYRRDIQREVA